MKPLRLCVLVVAGVATLTNSPPPPSPPPTGLVNGAPVAVTLAGDSNCYSRLADEELAALTSGSATGAYGNVDFAALFSTFKTKNVVVLSMSLGLDPISIVVMDGDADPKDPLGRGYAMLDPVLHSGSGPVPWIALKFAVQSGRIQEALNDPATAGTIAPVFTTGSGTTLAPHPDLDAQLYSLTTYGVTPIVAPYLELSDTAEELGLAPPDDIVAVDGGIALYDDPPEALTDPSTWYSISDAPEFYFTATQASASDLKTWIGSNLPSAEIARSIFRCVWEPGTSTTPGAWTTPELVLSSKQLGLDALNTSSVMPNEIDGLWIDTWRDGEGGHDFSDTPESIDSTMEVIYSTSGWSGSVAADEFWRVEVKTESGSTTTEPPRRLGIKGPSGVTSTGEAAGAGRGAGDGCGHDPFVTQDSMVGTKPRFRDHYLIGSPMKVPGRPIRTTAFLTNLPSGPGIKAKLAFGPQVAPGSVKLHAVHLKKPAMGTGKAIPSSAITILSKGPDGVDAVIAPGSGTSAKFIRVWWTFKLKAAAGGTKGKSARLVLAWRP